MNNYKLLKVLLFAWPILGLLSCFSRNEPAPFNRPDTCPEILDIGGFEMDENSVNFIPYSEPTKRIVFSDAEGLEYNAEISNYDFSLHTILSLSTIPCEEEPTLFFHPTYQAETKYLEATISELDIKIRFNLAVAIAINNNPPFGIKGMIQSDYLNISLQSPTNALTPLSQMIITVDDRDMLGVTFDLPTSEFYTIHDVEFENVYHRSEVIPEGEFNFFYNVQYGLIGLENSDQSISLKYERVEF